MDGDVAPYDAGKVRLLTLPRTPTPSSWPKITLARGKSLADFEERVLSLVTIQNEPRTVRTEPRATLKDIARCQMHT